MRIGRGIAVLTIAGLALGAASIVPAAADVPTVVTQGAKKAKKNTFVAPVPGTDAFIGIVIGKETAVAYLCDSAELNEWLTGAASNGILALESDSGSTLVARKSGNKVRGTVVLSDNQTLTFEAVKAKGKAGVFRKGDTVDGVTLADTWIRLADGSTRGAGGVAEGAENLAPLVEEAAPDGDPQGIAAAIDEVIADIADGAGVPPPPPFDPTELLQADVIPAPGGGQNLFPDGLDDLAVAPQIPSVCLPGFIQVAPTTCAPLPVIEVPEQPPPDAEPPVPPPLEETIAGAAAEPPPDAEPPAADAPPALGPAVVALPTGPVFDEEACSRIDRSLVLLTDEIDGLEEDSLTRQVFDSVFAHLLFRGALGGCVGLTGA